MSVFPSTAINTVEKPVIPLSRGKTLYVGGTGDGNYTKIQDAINNASDEDTVFVYDRLSPYYENLIVNKSINLIGGDRDTTIIDGNNSGQVVTVSADWVTISGFTIRNGETGIHIDSDYNTITGNNITSYSQGGIYLDYSNSNVILGNNIISNNGIGIVIDKSHNNTITSNNISNNWMGIYLDESSSNTVSGNNITSNKFYGGIHLDDSSSNNIAGNNISNNGAGMSIVNSHNNTITGNNITHNIVGGIALMVSSNNTITGNNISKNGISIVIDKSHSNTITGNNITSNNGAGMSIVNSHNNTITGNSISNNEHGIGIGNSYNSTITGNNITSNSWTGIYLDESSDNTITGNNITHNIVGGIALVVSSDNTITGNNISNNEYLGILLEYSSNYNIIYHNNFINNGKNAQDVCDNAWDNGYPSGGNYWDDYTGSDNFQGPNQDIPGSDDIGDTPYNIPGGENEDEYPFMNQNDWINQPPNKPTEPSPENNSENVDINPYLSVNVTDPEGDNMNVSFFDAFDDSLIGTDLNVVSGGIASVQWIGLSGSTTYTWYAIANNSELETKSDTWSFTTKEIDNNPPYVKIIKPEKALYIFNFKIRKYLFRFRIPLIIGKITIEANATDEDSGIERVEFYINDELKETDNTKPYTYNWTWNRPRIFHIFTIKVVAYDNVGITAEDKMLVRKFF
jgi:parallel beta-helix repeat protein